MEIRVVDGAFEVAGSVSSGGYDWEGRDRYEGTGTYAAGTIEMDIHNVGYRDGYGWNDEWTRDYHIEAMRVSDDPHASTSM